MKAAFFVCVVMIAISAVVPASSQALVVYDNFQTNFLNPDKWFGGESAAEGVDILESGRMINIEPKFGFKGFEMLNRSYASTASDSGFSTSGSRLFFFDGRDINTIQATVVVKKMQATECSTNLLFATEPRIRIGGMFFSTGAPNWNDILAYIAVARSVDSTKPANVLDVYGAVYLCTSFDCSQSDPIGAIQELGEVRVDQKVTLYIKWEKANNRFVFRKGGTVMYQTYKVPDNTPPSTANGGNKRLEIQHRIANCMTDTPRPMSYIDVFFDDIKVNP